MPVDRPRTAPLGDESFTVKVSALSFAVSPFTVMLTTVASEPAAIVTTPDLAT